jgi:Putative Ig domain
MDRRPATIRDAIAAKACADSVAPQRMAVRSISVFAVLLLLAGAPMLRSQATLGTTTGDTNALAINSNNSPGLAYNAVLNGDSSVSLLQDGAILSGQGCGPYMVPNSSSNLSVTSGAVNVDFASSRIYLAMISGGAVYAAYESIDQQGNCTQGPLLTLTTNSLSNLEMNVDRVQGSVYILNSFGAFPDTLYILPTAPWSASPLPTPAQVDLDYSAQYGPIVIDPSNHLVYVNDLGDSTSGTVGTYSTAGFFVYDPNLTPALLQHVTSYMNSSGPAQFNVGTLLTNGAGKLVLINENPHASTANLSVPITVIDTAQAGFSFSNPAAALSTISATSPYTAISGADIDPTNNVVYVFGFNSNSLTTPGLLLGYNLTPGASTETVLSSSAAMPSLYGSLAPWNQLNFNPESTELVLSVGSEFGSGALGLTSPLIAGSPLSLTQLFGSSVAPIPLGYPVVNAASGYVYAIQSGGIDFVAPPTGCSSTPTCTIGGSVSGLASGTSVTLFDNGGDSVTVTYPATSFTFPTALDSGASYAVTVGTQPTGETCTVANGSGHVATSNVANVSVTCGSSGLAPAQVTDKETITVSDTEAFPDVVDSEPITVTDTVTVTTGPTITTTALPAGIVGVQYAGATLTATGGSLPYNWTATGLPPGLTMSAAGVISGIPTTTGAYAVTVTVTDAVGNANSGNFSIAVTPSAPLAITTTGPLPAGIVGVQYAGATLAATGGSLPYTWTGTGLPPGLTIGPATGVISGRPTEAGVYLVTVTVTDATGLTSSANFSIAATASAPIANLSPTFLAFAAQPSGTASAAQTVTLSNTGNAPLSIAGTGISISGTNATDFSQTNPCGTSVAVGSNCVISVMFTPSLSAASGSYTATLNVVDNASGSPQQVGLSGIAIPPPSVSCNVPTINLSGDSGTAQVTCTATGPTGPIALVCDLPATLSAYITCNFSPSSLNFASGNTTSTTLTIEPVQAASLERTSRPWAESSSGVAFGAVLWLPAWAFATRRKKKRANRGLLFLIILLGGSHLVTSCGGKSKGPAMAPAGTYQASIVLAGPSLNETITFTIQVP